MVVRIIRREAAAPPKEDKAELSPLPMEIGGLRPEIKKTIKVGTSEIRPDIDLHYEQGKAKFLVNLRKPGIWYEVVDFDEVDKKTLKLRSKDDNTFMSKVHGTVSRNYMVVVEPEGTKAPSEEAQARVLKLLASTAGAPASLPEGGEVVQEKKTSKKNKLDKKILKDNGGSMKVSSGQKRPVKKDKKAVKKVVKKVVRWPAKKRK
jgi:hypothetical protein